MYKNTQSLNVYLKMKQSFKIGSLVINKNNIFFEYDKEFLKTGLEISPYKLPLKPGVFRCDDDTFEGLWGVFADSLPDGWGKLLVDRHLAKLGINFRAVSPLDRLAIVGNNGMGALCYVPANEVKSEFEEIILDDLAISSQNILEGSSDYLLDELLNLSGSSAGARPKVLVQISNDLKQVMHGKKELQNGFSHWMVKFASSIDSRDIGAIEYAYSLMAKEAGLDMPNTALLEGKRGRYFAIKRFDRIGDKRVHMHSVAGLIHTDFRYPTLDYDDLLKLTMHLTKSMQEVKKVFRLACFNLFSHNRDDHAKNFSFLMDEKGVWRFSPAYDITFSSGPGGEHSTMYLGEGRNPVQEHLEKLGQKYGIKEYREIIEEVKSAVSRWSSFAKKAGVNGRSIKEIGKVLKKLL